MTGFCFRTIPLAVAGLALAAGPLFAQPKAAAKQPVAKKPAAAQVKQASPATVEAATKVLDLRTFPLLEGAKVGGQRTLGMLMYEAKATPKAAVEFQRKELLKRGFKELPGGYSGEGTETADFTKEGFRVRTSASATGDPAKAGWSSVSVVNDGNVALDKLPTPPGVKPFPFGSATAAYTTDAKVAETAAACRKLLIAAGWVPYGQGDTNASDADSQMHYYKQNAIYLLAWVSTLPAQKGKTLIRYSTELLQADLPAPPEVEDPGYTDSLKRITFDLPKERTEAVLAFYQERLPKQGWQATTDKPVVDDRTRKQFLIFRNAQKELLSLDLQQFTDIVRVELKHQTAAELAAEEQRFKEQAALAKAEAEKKNRKIDVAVPLPAGAAKLEQENDNLFEFTLASGSGPAALTAFRDHFVKEGWKEQEGTELEENTGRLGMKKDEVRLHFSYFDTGLTDAEIRVSGPKNLVLKPILSKEKPASKEKPVVKTKPTQKPKPTIPGLPELPGVELPDDVADVLKKALEEAEGLKPPAGKKPAPKR